MSESYKIFPLRAQSGIKKDGTQTEGNYWNNGVWTRFYRGLPRSMKGYRSMTNAYPGPSRGLFVNSNSGYIDVFSGSANQLNVGQFTTDGFGSGINNITPSGFVTSPNNLWQLDSFFNSSGGGLIDLIAHAAPNLNNIDNSVATQVYYGDITSASPLTGALDDSMNPFMVSGGVCAIHPYAIAYGSGGAVNWSNLNDPTTWPVANQANPVATKIVKALSVQNSSAPPSCLLWSLDSLVQMYFVGGTDIWDFNVISDQSSVLSSSAMVEMDGIYYWPGIDRFLTFNSGTLRELPNELNLDFFYANLNYAQRQKVFGFKVPRWGEVCFCAPMFGAVECNWMFIYNVRENSWYDTPLPADGRSAAYFAQAWQYPVMFGANPYPSTYQLWQHEYGDDEVIGQNVNAIDKYILSPSASIVGGGLTFLGSAAATPSDNWTQLVRFEGDFVLNGSVLNVVILGRTNAMDSDTQLDIQSIPNSGFGNCFDTNAQARYVRFQLNSNEQGGSFIMGTPLISYRQGDQNPA